MNRKNFLFALIGILLVLNKKISLMFKRDSTITEESLKTNNKLLG